MTTWHSTARSIPRATLAIAIWAALLLAPPSQAQGSLAADIRTGSNSSSPTYLTALDGDLYFRANDGSTGNELWRYDPATGAASRAADIRTGINSSSPTYLTALDGDLYFRANDGSTGNELWRYDPATGAASRVADIRTGSNSSSPAYLTALDGDLYFAANDGSTGNELWRYDPATGVASRAADIRTGSNPSSPTYLTALDGDLYFVANDGSTGSELWRYDPATGAASRAADIRTGSNSSSPTYLTALYGDLYFLANDGSTGSELWRYEVPQAIQSVTLQGAAGWRLLASPEPQTVEGFLAQFWTQGYPGSDDPAGECTVFTFVESAASFADGWTCVSDGTDALAVGEGLMVFLFEDDDPGQTGVQNPFPKTLASSSVVEAPGTFTITPAFTDDSRPASQKGWNLVGSPAGTGVAWEYTTRTAMSSTAYVYDPGFNGGDYRTVTESNGVAYGDLQGGVIPPFQGFFVRALSTTASLGAGLEAATTGANVYGRQGTPTTGRLRLGEPPLPPATPLQSTPNATAAEDLPEGATALGSVVPNPTSGGGAVAWTLAAAGHARVAVYDALGREVAVLAEGAYGAGPQRASVPAGLVPGVYVVRLAAGSTADAARFTVVR